MVAMIKLRSSLFCCSMIVMMPPTNRTRRPTSVILEVFAVVVVVKCHVLDENAAGGYHAVRGRCFQFRIIRYKEMGTIGAYKTISAMAAAVWELTDISGVISVGN